jgi:hypothetical protein
MKRPTRSAWARLQDFTYSHKKLAIGLSASMTLLAVTSVATTWYFLPPQQEVNTTAQPEQAQELAAPTAAPKKYYSPLTGVEVADEAATKRQVTGIMIENSPSARPQSGIKEAGVVFEAIAEGGITRLATLHQEDRPGTIGPVRSIRPYYLDWMAPFDASISHVGGSANALATVRNGSFKDIDQFFNGASYWRATDRVAPHNVYTNSDRLDALNQKKGFVSSSFTSWPRKKDTPTATPTASTINISVSSPTYNVRYEYDKNGNKYNRFIGGAASTDRELGQVTPKVVIALKVPTHLGMEDGPREQMTTDGHNDALIFQDGTVIKAVWRKTGQKNQMTFYDKNGHIVALNPGQTWITVVAPEKAVSWQ